MRKRFISFLIIIYLAIFTNHIIVFAEPAPGNDFFEFILRVVEQHNLEVVSKALYHQYSNLNIDASTIEDMIKIDLLSIRVSHDSALEAVKNIYIGLNKSHRAALYNFYYDVKDKINFNITYEIYNQLGLSYFNEAVAQSSTYNQPVDYNGIIFIEKDDFSNNVLMPLLDKYIFPLVGSYGSLNSHPEIHSHLAERNISFDSDLTSGTHDLSALNGIAENRFYLLYEYARTNIIYRNDGYEKRIYSCYIFESDDFPQYIEEYEGRYLSTGDYLDGSGNFLLDEICSDLAFWNAPDLIKFNNKAALNTYHIDYEKLIYDSYPNYYYFDNYIRSSKLLYFSLAGNYIGDFVSNKAGLYYVLPEFDFSIIETIVNNIFITINQDDNINYISITNNNVIDDFDLDWLNNLMRIIKGLSVPNIEIIINNYFSDEKATLPSVDLSSLSDMLNYLKDSLLILTENKNVVDDDIDSVNTSLNNNFSSLENNYNDLSSRIDSMDSTLLVKLDLITEDFASLFGKSLNINSKFNVIILLSFCGLSLIFILFLVISLRLIFRFLWSFLMPFF